MLIFSLPTARRIRLFIIFLGILGLRWLSVPVWAQSLPDPDAWTEKLNALRFAPLEILPVSDCQLSDLESDIFRAYAAQNKAIPIHLTALMQQKRACMDFMRGHIDSLYYIQALQALNQPVPDWEAAENAIEKALLHNRFFDRAVVFKLNNLLKRKRNAQTILRYLNTVLQECSYPSRIRQMAQTVYISLLEETEKLIAGRQYRDALDLCLLLHAYCQPGFPIRYIPYKEKTLENLAHQGIFRSHCEVAQKAFFQKQYQLAQKYALRAHDYYVENEAHMNGVNQALDLLDQIADQYLRFAALSDFAEKAYYHALVDSIVHKTGLVVELSSNYNADNDISADISLLNRPDTGTIPEKPAAGFVSMRAGSQSTVASAPALKPQQAQKEFNLAMEQAHYFNARRDFEEAFAWTERALELKKRYRITADQACDTLYRSTLALAIEQLVNKAIYHLWTHNSALADSLYLRASAWFGNFKANHPEEVGMMTQMQQMLQRYQLKKQENACEALLKSIEGSEAEFYRQASYGNLHLAARNVVQLDTLLLLYRLPEYAACKRPSRKSEEIHHILDCWHLYARSLDSAFHCLNHDSDTLGFIKLYLASDSLYRRLGLKPYTPSAPSLFSRLSAGGDLQSIQIWLRYCIETKDLEQARFLHGYLRQKNYHPEINDRLEKTLKRIH